MVLIIFVCLLVHLYIYLLFWKESLFGSFAFCCCCWSPNLWDCNSWPGLNPGAGQWRSWKANHWTNKFPNSLPISSGRLSFYSFEYWFTIFLYSNELSFTTAVLRSQSFSTWPFMEFDYFLFPILSLLDLRTSQFLDCFLLILYSSPQSPLLLILISSNSKHWSAHGLSPILHYLLCSHLYADNFTFTIRLVYSSAYLTIWLNRYLIGISNLKNVKIKTSEFFVQNLILSQSSSSQ